MATPLPLLDGPDGDLSLALTLRFVDSAGDALDITGYDCRVGARQTVNGTVELAEVDVPVTDASGGLAAATIAAGDLAGILTTLARGLAVSLDVYVTPDGGTGDVWGSVPLSRVVTAASSDGAASYARYVDIDVLAAGTYTLNGVRVTGPTSAGGGGGSGDMTKAVYDSNDDGVFAVAQGGTGAATASGARTALGVAVGSDVQAYSAELAAVAALSGATYGRSLLTLADAAALRTSAGVSTTVTSVRLAADGNLSVPDQTYVDDTETAVTLTAGTWRIDHVSILSEPVLSNEGKVRFRLDGAGTLFIRGDNDKFYESSGDSKLTLIATTERAFRFAGVVVVASTQTLTVGYKKNAHTGGDGALLVHSGSHTRATYLG